MRAAAGWLLVMTLACVGDEARVDECPSGDCLECSGGTERCGDVCVDKANDPAHCGACDNACPAGKVCSQGACGDMCGGGTLLCDGLCVDTASSLEHCGDCGNACDANEQCMGGSCRLPASCVEVTATTDGIYTIDPNGGDVGDALEAWCDMTTDGGGWTAIVANGALDTETTAPADCYPLITDDAARGCGSPELDDDFTMSGAQQAALSWRYLLAIVYDDGGYSEKLAYFAIDFGTAAATTEERIGGTPYDPSVTTLHGEVACAPDHIVHYAKATSQVAAGKGTVFGHDSAPNMASPSRKTFGFTDASAGASGQLEGVDDYQDGSSCGDDWVPQAVRGKRMVVLVR